MSAASVVAPPLAALVVAALATAVLARLAPRLAWLDRARPGEGARKLQARPVPPVGGAAILLGLGAGAACAAVLGGGAAPETAPAAGLVAWPAAPLTWLALGLAFAIGTLDDALGRGLSPVAKLAGLAAAVVALLAPELGAAAASGEPERIALALGLAALALFAAEAFCVLDHADGVAGGTALVGAACAGAGLGAAVAGFLPFNLSYPASGDPPSPPGGAASDPAGSAASDAAASAASAGRRPSGGAWCAPRAYLGDAGSHLVAVALLASPARAVLVLPALDFARVIAARLAAGEAPWRGDRRHLGHRLQRAGLAPRAVAAAVAACALPAALAPVLWPAPGAPALELARGGGVTLLGWLGLLAATARAERVAPRGAVRGAERGEREG